jgi:hypothetical protein
MELLHPSALLVSTVHLTDLYLPESVVSETYSYIRPLMSSISFIKYNGKLSKFHR